MSKFHGIAPAFYACYDKNGEINPDMVRKFTNHLIKKEINLQIQKMNYNLKKLVCKIY